MYKIILTKDEVLYLETILARPQDPVEDIGNLSKDILTKLEEIDL